MGIPGFPECVPAPCMSSTINVYAAAAGCTGLFDVSSLLHSAASAHRADPSISLEDHVLQSVVSLLVHVYVNHRILPICIFEPTEGPRPKLRRENLFLKTSLFSLWQQCSSPDTTVPVTSAAGHGQQTPDGITGLDGRTAVQAGHASFRRTDALQFALASKLTSRGFPCVMAPFEADAQLVALQQTPVFQDAAIFAYDYDLAILGANHFFLVSSFSRGEGRLYRSPKVLFASGLADAEEFPHLRSPWALPAIAALSSSDYGSVKGVGLKGASKFLHDLARKTSANVETWTPVSIARAFVLDPKIRRKISLPDGSLTVSERDIIRVMYIFAHYPVVALHDSAAPLQPLTDPEHDSIWNDVLHEFSTSFVKDTLLNQHRRLIHTHMFKGPHEEHLPQLADILAPKGLPRLLVGTADTATRALYPNFRADVDVGGMTPKQLAPTRRLRRNVPTDLDQAREVIRSQDKFCDSYPSLETHVLNDQESVEHRMHSVGTIPDAPFAAFPEQIDRLVEKGSFAPFLDGWYSSTSQLASQMLFLCEEDDVLRDLRGPSLAGSPQCPPYRAWRQTARRKSSFNPLTVTIGARKSLRFVRATMSRSAGKQDQYMVFVCVRVTPRLGDTPSRFCALMQHFCQCTAGAEVFCPHVCSLLVGIHDLCKQSQVSRSPSSSTASPTDILCAWLRPSGTEVYSADKPIEDYTLLTKYGVPSTEGAKKAARVNSAEDISPTISKPRDSAAILKSFETYKAGISGYEEREAKRHRKNDPPGAVEARLRRTQRDPFCGILAAYLVPHRLPNTYSTF
eukprot:m.178638 g.178638  ORF g.178638 m.178638 type:complete len:796 (-) comp10450_c0_seq7:4157-6544(-)